VVIIPFNLCKNIKWKFDIYEAAGYYIKECCDNNKDKHVYIDEDLCCYKFYNAFESSRLLALACNGGIFRVVITF
jgi:hypothetical protein